MTPVQKISNLVKKLMYVLKLFLVTAGNIHSFPIRSEETRRIMCFGLDPKNPPPLWIIWINIPFFDFRKEKK